MVKIGILGASGLVGQMAIALIKRSKRFTLAEVLSSRKFLDLQAPYILSALPAKVAEEMEPQLLARGQHVFSNASAFRMKEDVPLLIPEVNLSHLSLVKKQKTPGKLICNPNCMVALIAPLLAPLVETLTHVTIVTMQAISGAGKNFTLADTLIPNIAGEEEKIERELEKIFAPHHFSVDVQVTRVPILHGHSCVLHMVTKERVEIEKCYTSNLYKLYDDPFSPQPKRDLGPFDEKIHVGRIKQRGNRISLVGMTHNLVRGAALGSLLNLEAFLEGEW